MLKRIGLTQLSQSALRALADGDLNAANRAMPLQFGAHFVSAEWRGTWRRRAAQIIEDPTSEVWITRAIVDLDHGFAVGRAGFHGPPDQVGMVEVGYAVDPTFRRQGYARAALVALLRRAREDPTVHTVRATITPANLASRDLVGQYGFIEVGEQWDDEDGLETIFEVAAGQG